MKKSKKKILILNDNKIKKLINNIVIKIVYLALIKNNLLIALLNDMIVKTFSIPQIVSF